MFIVGGYEAPALDVGTYIARYTLGQDQNEYNPIDNTVNMNFEVTENTFQKDDGIFVQATRPSFTTQYEYGNLYFVPRSGYKAINASYSIAVNQGTNLAGQTFLMKLYKINEDDNPDLFTDDDVELVGIANETFPDDFTNFTVYTVNLFDFVTLDPGVILEADTEYILTFGYSGNDDVFTTYTEVPYGNRVTDILRAEGASGAQSPWFLGGFSGETTPVVRMGIDLASSTKEPELGENKIKLYPNPTVDQINLDLELDDYSDNVTILIRDLNGRTLRQIERQNVKKEVITLDTFDLNSGMFIMTIRTQEGVRSEKFMVMKVR